MTTQTPQQIGDSNQNARNAATETLAEFKGKKVSRLAPIKQRFLLTAVLQWLGLADKNGLIK